MWYFCTYYFLKAPAMQRRVAAISNTYCMIRFFYPYMLRQCIDDAVMGLSSYYKTRTLTHFPFRCFSTQQLIGSVSSNFTPSNPVFDSHKYGSALQNCIQNCDLVSGQGLHCEIIKCGCCLDLFANNILLNLYVQFELLSEACKLFDEMAERNTISFITLIQGYCRSSRFNEAVELFIRLSREGHELNPFVFTTILKLLVSISWEDMCWSIHAFTYKLGHHANAFVGTALIDAYSVCGCVDIARQVFDGILDKDMVSWTGMVACYAKNDCFEESLKLYSEMQIVGYKPNNFTIAGVLKSCLGLEAFDEGRSVHAFALKTCHEFDLFVGIALLELYAKLRNINDAQKLFEEMPKDDLIPWSLMIARYAQSDRGKEALDLFLRMRRHLIIPNQFTFASVLQACASIEALDFGKQIHSCIHKAGLDSDVFVSNALMDVYAKCGMLEICMKLFTESSNRNNVTWNTIIVGYMHQGDGENALAYFVDMLRNSEQATEVTYSSVLRACASLAALDPALQVHSLTVKTIYNKDIVVANSLIDTYAKCGSIKEARLVFDKMSQRDEVTWNAMICGYSMHGMGADALHIFDMMLETKCKPNKLTFVGVLSACSNAGLLEKGQNYFNSMVRDYDIEPCMEHYTCMVGLLGRSGHHDKAMKLIDEIPFQPSVMVWRALLGACVVHNNVDLGRTCAQHVLEMEPHDDATHVLLSNMYASSKHWDGVASVRKSMKKKGVKKEPGLSWIEYQGIVHYFSVGDTSHPDIKFIHAMLEWMNMKTRKAGYKPNCDVVLLDIANDEKERLLWQHSERLALAFSILKTSPGSTIRILKNLRICVDCHIVIKLVSEFSPRDIVIRDINRFHHFQHGVCSCGDYW